MAALAEARILTPEDYPALYRATDAQSQRAQGRYLMATRVRLGLVLTAAAVGVAAAHADDLDWLAWLGAAAFIAATFLEVFLRNTRPERLWYDGRAAAESAKSLAWRYAVGGNPFPVFAGDADHALVGQLQEVVRVLPGTHLVPDDPDGQQVTDVMRQLRASPLPVRREAYRSGRVADQKSWYGQRARENESGLRRWSVVLVVTELAGAVACVLQAGRVIRLDLAAIAAAFVAAAVAWLETRQHGTVASAYAVAHHELGMIEARIEDARTDEEWAGFVAESEEAISREHTLWRASRRC